MNEQAEPSKSLVIIEPAKDPEIVSLYNEAIKLQRYAQSQVIRTADDLKPATNDLFIIAKIKKALEEKRKDYVKPLQDHVKTINDAFKTFMEPIESADKIIRQKVLAFQAEQEHIRREQEEINRLRMDAARKEMELKGEISEPVQLVEVMIESPRRVSTDMGTVGQRMINKWEIVDFKLVPDEYKMVDSAKITKLVNGGGTIPGIRTWKEPVLTVNTR